VYVVFSRSVESPFYEVDKASNLIVIQILFFVELVAVLAGLMAEISFGKHISWLYIAGWDKISSTLQTA
jgi:hypothetical protein